jgi:hypothetical protein
MAVESAWVANRGAFRKRSEKLAVLPVRFIGLRRGSIGRRIGRRGRRVDQNLEKARVPRKKIR